MDRPVRVFDVRVPEDAEPGHFSGYASVFGVLDSYNTVFDAGSFKKTIKEHSGQLPIVWMHDVYEPIGLAQVTEDERGLWVEGQLDLDVQRGREVYSGMKKGYITQMSHSFKSVKEKPIKGEDGVEVLHFKEVKSFEVSPTTANFAANEEAKIVSVRTEQRVPAGLTKQMERLTALLSEPSKDTREPEPQCKPSDHLRKLQEAVQRTEKAMRGE